MYIFSLQNVTFLFIYLNADQITLKGHYMAVGIVVLYVNKLEGIVGNIVDILANAYRYGCLFSFVNIF